MFKKKPEMSKVPMPFVISKESLEEMKTYMDTCIELIIDFWKVSKTMAKLPESPELSALREDMQRFSDSLKKNGFVIDDLTGKTYNEGLSVRPIHFEKAKEGELAEPVIAETIRPIIYLKGRVIEHGEVIVKEPYSGKGR